MLVTERSCLEKAWAVAITAFVPAFSCTLAAKFTHWVMMFPIWAATSLRDLSIGSPITRQESTTNCTSRRDDNQARRCLLLPASQEDT